jgi:hypothetical protein
MHYFVVFSLDHYSGNVDTVDKSSSYRDTQMPITQIYESACAIRGESKICIHSLFKVL